MTPSELRKVAATKLAEKASEENAKRVAEEKRAKQWAELTYASVIATFAEKSAKAAAQGHTSITVYDYDEQNGDKANIVDPLLLRLDKYFTGQGFEVTREPYAASRDIDYPVGPGERLIVSWE